jgi:hypothetical protein
MMLVESGEEILLTPVGFTWLWFHLKKPNVININTFSGWNKTQNKSLKLSVSACYKVISLPTKKCSLPSFRFFQWEIREIRYITVEAACRHEVKIIFSGNNDFIFRSGFRLLAQSRSRFEFRPKLLKPNIFLRNREQQMTNYFLGLQTGIKSISLPT